MNRKLVAFILLLAVVGSVTIYYVYAPPSNATSEISCPQDESLYVWTPIGTFSENLTGAAFSTVTPGSRHILRRYMSNGGM